MDTASETKKEVITILRRPLEIEHATRAVEELRLDPLNPRIRHEQAVRETEGLTLTEEQIEEILWKDEEVKRLYRAIVASRGLSEPLYITRNGRTVEGNERLVALRKLRSNLDAGHFPDDESRELRDLVAHISCKILPNDITQTEIDVLLARLHVSGKHEWPALNQAAHIFRLNEEDGLTVEDIAEVLGKSKPWVYQKLQAFRWTEAYRDVYGQERIRDYSFFEELYKIRKKLRDTSFDVDEPENMEAFHRIVADRVLKGALEVRKLPKLLKNEETREYLLKGQGRKALQKLPVVDPSEFSPRFAALQRALDQLGKMTREDLVMIRDYAAYRKLLEDVRNQVDDVLSQLRVVE